MKKYFTGFIQSSAGILIILMLIISIPIFIYMYYSKPINIQYSYNGIKYQAGNLQSAEPIKIVIKGAYTRNLFENYVDFDGTITVGEEIFKDRTISFNKYKMATLDTNKGTYGTIFISKMFKELTIEILVPNKNGGYSFDPTRDFIISAPCNDRKSAVEITNILEQKLHENFVVE